MEPYHRRDQIFRQLVDTGEVSIAQLAEELNVSEMTVRRDLEALEADGRARRVRGGAISLISRAYEPPLAVRNSTAADAKAAIGRAAAELVDDGDTVIIDTGSTALAVARSLRARRGLTVVTPSPLVVMELGGEPGIRLYIVGGYVRTNEFSVIGGDAEDTFRRVNCDLAFIGVAGVHPERGFTEYNADDARVKRAAIAAARRSVVVADETKLGKLAFALVAPATNIDSLITDAPRGHPVVTRLAALGTEVICVETSRSAGTAVG